MTAQDHLATALWEADRHLAALETARRDWQAAPASDLEALECDHEKLRLLDQLLFRFTKLQDAMGLRLVPATLAALSEPFEDWPMIDRLNRLEKLGFLDVYALAESAKLRQTIERFDIDLYSLHQSGIDFRSSEDRFWNTQAYEQPPLIHSKSKR